MMPIVYKVVGSRGRWFIEHSAGRYGPFSTKKQALSIASTASAEGERHGLEVVVDPTGSKDLPG